MQPLIQQLKTKLEQIIDRMDSIVGQGVIVVLAIAFAAAAGASA